MSIERLQVLAVAIGVTSAALAVGAAVALDAEGPTILSSVIILTTAVVALLTIGWMRQRPVQPGDADTYFNTAIIKLAVAELPATLSFVLALIAGPGWIAILGFGATAVGLMLVWPSDADRERHELLYLV